MPDPLAVIAALPNPVIVVGPDNRIIAINPPARRLLGDDGLGRHYITALRQPAVLDAVEDTFADGVHRATRFLAKDGARDTVWDVTAMGLDQPAGRAVVLSFQDMTAVEDAGVMRRDFVANVSHELRTPLTALLGFIETLRGPAKDDRVARDRFLGIMEQEAGRMHRLVEDLLSLSRVEDQERIRPDTKVDVAQLLRDVINALTPVAEAADVTLVAEIPDASVEVRGDWGQLWQVAQNLIENAVKYGASGGQVTIGLTQPRHEPALRQHGVRISVADAGEGIAAHHIARLTERFYRVDSHRSREVGGTGLGLAISKHIINRHRGRLRIDSTIGQGAVFTVLFPSEDGPTDR